MTQTRRETLVEWFNSLRYCRFERPEIRRPLKRLRFASMIFCFIVFAAALSITLLLQTSTLVLVGVTVFAFVAAEAIYHAVRAYLLRNLKHRRARNV